MQLLICAGGTGGGVYPALAVLQALGTEANSVLWVGGEGGMEAELIQRLSIPFTAIPAAGVHGVGLCRLPGNLIQLIKGTLAANKIIRTFKPDVLLFTGGYVSAPLAVAGHKLPSLLYVPDVEPGLAIKFAAQFADCIALTASDSQVYFSNKKHLVITGYPTRSELVKWNNENGRKELGLKNDFPILLVFGGSKGARSINRALLAVLPGILEIAQVVHISGQLDWPEVETARAELPPALQNRYFTFPYLHEQMGAALASADLVVSRAGASTLGEYPLFGLPAILVPYPHAWRYQKVNADLLVSKGAAELLNDEDLQTQLSSKVQELLGNPTRLEKMRSAMRGANPPDSASRIAALIKDLAREQKGIPA